jgi:endonuclease YncB( thermonuclease family)
LVPFSDILAAAVTAQLAFMSACVGAAAQERLASVDPVAAATPCGGDVIARGSIKAILDGGNIALDDGRVVHLAGIEVPLSPAVGSEAAKSALAALVSGAQVVLRRADLPTNVPDLEPDRYGRVVAYVQASRRNSQRSVEADMLAAGAARVGEDAGGQACVAELLQREAYARKAKLGLWASPYYDPLRADEPASILAQRDHFALVEGEVASVHESGATVYVNFGQHWSEDFSVTVRKRNERNFAGLDLKGLSGRRIRVRGFVEAHNGTGTAPREDAAGGRWRAPWIEAAHPVQIEFADRD